MMNLEYLVVICNEKDINEEMKKEAEDVGITLISF